MKDLCTRVALSLIVLSHDDVRGDETSNVEHTIVAIEKDRFHGWPANNGVWTWGDEILVGLTQGDFTLRKGHNIGGRQDSLLARSLDGGRSWKMFDPTGFLDDENRQFLGDGKKALEQPLDFTHTGFALRVFASGYHGNNDPEGGFFYSYDRGQNWTGPHTLNGLSEHPELEGKILSPRTDYLVQGGRRCLVFISAGDTRGSQKQIGCVQTTDGGLTFEFVAWVTPETTESRGIMSQTVQLSGHEFILAFRKIYTDSRDDTIESYRSTDGCNTWAHLSTIKVMETQSNPPALLRLNDGRICCAYGDRHVGEIRARYSHDHGRTWGPEQIIRDDFQAMQSDPDSQEGLNADIGYVRLALRSDGKLVAIYYWVTAKHPQQHIAASIWEP